MKHTSLYAAPTKKVYFLFADPRRKSHQPLTFGIDYREIYCNFKCSRNESHSKILVFNLYNGFERRFFWFYRPPPYPVLSISDLQEKGCSPKAHNIEYNTIHIVARLILYTMLYIVIAPHLAYECGKSALREYTRRWIVYGAIRRCEQRKGVPRTVICRAIDFALELVDKYNCSLKSVLYLDLNKIKLNYILLLLHR